MFYSNKSLSKEGRRVVYTIWEYDPLLDSSNMTMTDWARLARDIQVCHQWERMTAFKKYEGERQRQRYSRSDYYTT